MHETQIHWMADEEEEYPKESQGPCSRKNKECRIGNTKGYQLKKDKSEAVEVNWRVMLLFQFLQKLPLK